MGVVHQPVTDVLADTLVRASVVARTPAAVAVPAALLSGVLRAAARRLVVAEPGRDLVAGAIEEAALVAVAAAVSTAVTLVGAVEASEVVVPAAVAAIPLAPIPPALEELVGVADAVVVPVAAGHLAEVAPRPAAAVARGIAVVAPVLVALATASAAGPVPAAVLARVAPITAAALGPAAAVVVAAPAFLRAVTRAGVAESALRDVAAVAALVAAALSVAVVAKSSPALAAVPCRICHCRALPCTDWTRARLPPASLWRQPEPSVRGSARGTPLRAGVTGAPHSRLISDTRSFRSSVTFETAATTPRQG